MADKKTPTFAPANFSNQVFTKEAKKKFDNLPGWERHFVQKIIDHGDLKKAAAESGISRHFKENVDLQLTEYKSIRESLLQGGITSNDFVDHLKMCLHAETPKIVKGRDGKEKMEIIIDYKLKLETLKLIAKLAGYDKEPTSGDPKKLGGEYDELFIKDD